MDIYAYAMKFEKDSEQFYRTIADTTDDKGLQTIMTMLADDETKHYNAVAVMRMNNNYNIENSVVLTRAKSIFADMESTRNFSVDLEQIDLFREARKIEKKSMDFYNEKAEETDNPKHTELFRTLASEERKHYFLMDNIIELLMRPKQWLEFAEWYHLDEY